MRLRILSINDVYELEHLPRLATLLRAHELPAPDVTISVVAGDFVGPSLLSSLDAGRGMVDCLNAVGIDYAGLGNHEDDIPPSELHARVAEFRGTWIATNVDFDPAMPRDAIVVVGGHTVGLVATVMDDPKAFRGTPFGGAVMRPALTSALAAIEALKARGCEAVVAITHQPLAADAELARTRTVPLIIGGHEHVPCVEKIDGTWVVKAGVDGAAAIVSDIAFGDTGTAPTVTVARVSVDGYAEDAAVRARVDEHLQKVRELASATLVEVHGEPLSSIGSRARTTTLGTMLCDCIRDVMFADAAVLNGGAIRAGREYRERFTYGDLEAEVPFSNEVVVVDMPGGTLAAAIAFSRRHAPRESGGFLQASIAIDAIDEARTYRVALVRNLLAGMDHNEVLVAFAATIAPPLEGRPLKTVLAEAFALELWKKLAHFDDIDRDRDGALDEAEVIAALARISPQAPSHIVAKLLVQVRDKNNNARIERSESV